MAICQFGRELIARGVEGPDVWSPDVELGHEPTDHHEHKPAVLITVERWQGAPASCDGCSVGEALAEYQVGGQVFACRDHLASSVNLCVAYVATATP